MKYTQTDDDLLNGPVSPEVRACAMELMEVCRKHGMQLCPNDSNGLDLWRAEPGDPPIYTSGFRDKT